MLFFGFLFLLTSPLHDITLRSTGIAVLPSFVGYAIMLYACHRLSPYGVNFKRSRNLYRVLFPLGFLASIISLIDARTEKAWITKVKDVFENIEGAILGVTLVLMFLALSQIAADVGKKTLSARAKLGAILSGGYYALMLPVMLFVPGASGSKWLAAVNYIVWIAIFVFDCFQIYGCYMWICYEGDEDMPYKPGKMEKLLSKLVHSQDDLPEGSKNLKTSQQSAKTGKNTHTKKRK